MKFRCHHRAVRRYLKRQRKEREPCRAFLGQSPVRPAREVETRRLQQLRHQQWLDLSEPTVRPSPSIFMDDRMTSPFQMRQNGTGIFYLHEWPQVLGINIGKYSIHGAA